jgi:penicillin-insensitive murein endopeptidase
VSRASRIFAVSSRSFRLILIGLAASLVACVRAPSPLSPMLTGTIGVPHRGVLTEPAELPREGDGHRWLRDNDRHWGIPRFVDAIARASAVVARERPGALLCVGDLSVASGGVLMPHFSHRTGRDADLLLYVTTLDGAPVDSPGFIHFDADGLAWDGANRRFLRFDVDREWLLVKTLVEDDDARIQWIFASRMVEAWLVEHARALGEPSETILRAERVMLQPMPGGPHDDHVHVRTACTDDEIAHGCEPSGPAREWIPPPPASSIDEPAEALVEELMRPFESSPAVATAAPFPSP